MIKKVQQIKLFFIAAICCISLTSCDRLYPLLDYVIVEKNTSDIYARNDSYAADTMCLDTALVASFKNKQNISARWQYNLAKPKVEWQRDHLEWIESKSGRSMRWVLFRVIFIIPIVGFWIPMLIDKLQERRHLRKRDKLSSKAAKAEQKGDLVKAEQLYAECEKMEELPQTPPVLSWSSRLMPYTLLLMLITEGAYLFMFNFNMSMLSPMRVGLLNAFVNIFLLLSAILAHILIIMLYSDYLAHANSSSSSLWKLPLKWSLILAIPLIFLINTFAMPFDIIILLLGLICCVYILVKDKKVRNVDVRVFALAMLLSYIFMYVVAYTLLVIFTIGLIVLGIMLGIKAVSASVDISIDNEKINQHMRNHPGETRDQAEYAYYAEKRAEMRKKIEEQAKQNF